VRQTFKNPGEQALDDWMTENAFVTWRVCDQPWDLEREILTSGLSLPLNIRDNPCAAHTAVVKAARRAAVAEALDFPIVRDNGGPRHLVGKAPEADIRSHLVVDVYPARSMNISISA
jgi:hypothetical protein